MSYHFGTRGEFSRQASIARELGSPFVAQVLEAAERNLAHAPRTAALIENWPGDPAAAALAMRFNAAIHALARRGSPEALEALYLGEHKDFDGALAKAMAVEDDFIAEWMNHPTQTNEVCRSAAIISALMVAKREFGLPFELLEIGSSAGLNLNLAHYAYDLGGVAAGDAESPVRIAPEWRGAPPPAETVAISSACGVDLRPLDVRDSATRERLMSYIFADQPLRAERLRQALAVAQRHPPRVDRADAITWLGEQLARPQPEGQCRVVFHSMVTQYFSPRAREIGIGMLATAGAAASRDRPLAKIGFEWTEERSEVRLTLTCWPSGEARHLATCHPYGAWIEWRA